MPREGREAVSAGRRRGGLRGSFLHNDQHSPLGHFKSHFLEVPTRCARQQSNKATAFSRTKNKADEKP